MATRVYKEQGSFGTLRELVRAYLRIMYDSVRAQNRVVAIFRSRGVQLAHAYTLGAADWSTWSKKLPPRYRVAAKTQYDEMILLRDLREHAEADMIKEAGKHRIWKIMQTLPGLGEIRAAQLISIIVDPSRFRTRRQFTAYCGFAVMTRSSGDWRKRDGEWKLRVPMTRGLNNNDHPLLKNIFVGAAMTIVMQLRGTPLHEFYQRLVARSVKPGVAKMALARKLVGITFVMWKRMEEYSPTKHQPMNLKK